MRMVGNEVYIQRGETWSLDFEVTNEKGHPFVVLKNWQNPYIAISIAAALYEQAGDYRETYWLDLNNRWAEQSDGSMSLVPLKKFISGEVLSLELFSVAEAMAWYGKDVGGKIVLDRTSDFDVTNFLFFVDERHDGNYKYAYVTDYTVLTQDRYDDMGNLIAVAGDIVDEVWVDYDFRVIKQFNTKSWMEQGYLYDIKVLAGESVQEHLIGILETQQTPYNTNITAWTNEDWEDYIAMIEDPSVRENIQALYDDGAPLMPSYDTKSLLLDPTPIYVSVNIQGGVK